MVIFHERVTKITEKKSILSVKKDTTLLSEHKRTKEIDGAFVS